MRRGAAAPVPTPLMPDDPSIAKLSDKDIEKQVAEMRSEEIAKSDLHALASRINAFHREVTKALRTAISEALLAGDLLNQAKTKVAHGEWLPWLSANCPRLKPRTAQTYMRLANHRDEVEAKAQRTAHLHATIEQALSWIAIPPTPPVMDATLRGMSAPAVIDIDPDAAAPKAAVSDPGIEDDLIEDPENYRTAYLLRVDQAIRFATYSGPITDEIVAGARAVAAAWTKLAQKMELAVPPITAETAANTQAA
jgi:Protein of unknown function (DUF3102)